MNDTDERFVQRLRDSLKTPVCTEVQSRKFDRALRARIERRPERSRRPLIGLAAAALAGAVATWLLLPSPAEPPTVPTSPATATASAETPSDDAPLEALLDEDAWVLLSWGPSDATDDDDPDDAGDDAGDDALLPPDYRLLADLFLPDDLEHDWR